MSYFILQTYFLLYSAADYMLVFHLSHRLWLSTGQERENQLLLNCFTIWCQWAGIIIRVDKCVTFGTNKGTTKSMQFQPKLIINSESGPPVMNDYSFRYLGRHFDFNMSNGKHKSKLVEILGSLMSNIDKLPMYPKNKLYFHQRYVLSKCRDI